MTLLPLVENDGTIRSAPLESPRAFVRPTGPITSRAVYAAAHVVPRWSADSTPGRQANLDWDATIAFRHHLWSWGLGVADAMDTAQRNMGLDPATTRELIRRTAAASREVGGALVVGANTDHVEEQRIGLDRVADAYTEQLHFAEDAGAGVVLMASRHLARAARSEGDYRRVYGRVLSAAGGPIVLHWLGGSFDSELSGYFGSDRIEAAEAVLLRIVEEHQDRIAGIKLSLLDAAAEVRIRRRLPPSVRMFTGDDFHYVDLIAGDGSGHSDALLGAFAGFAPVASAALQALDQGDPEGYLATLRPTERLSRAVFEAPTQHYKVGIAFLAWLNGHQPAFTMVGGLQSSRSLPHLSRVIELANASGALERPDLAVKLWGALLTVHGVEPERRPISSSQVAMAR